MKVDYQKFKGVRHWLCGEEVILLPYRALFWVEKKSLLIADLHIGKGAHFRKNGVALPLDINNDNLWRLAGLLLDTKADRLILLGDLFHSSFNDEWHAFVDMLDNFPKLKTVLVKGNHDILDQELWDNAKIDVVEELCEEPFVMCHEPSMVVDERGYRLCGHIHPAVRLLGAGRQSLKLPCFWFSEHQGVFPTFGYFTGSVTVQPGKKDVVFVVTDESVLRI
ncbi:MAG: ligase-associated DNA damage response endonuclease PdeM [Cryomorphaceae bacterium]|nr:ligase-associated DNA damage response endonuclease PdeM [Cryomorphaceae bacterium]